MLKLIIPIQHSILHQDSIWLFDDTCSRRVVIVIMPYTFTISTCSLYLKWLLSVELVSVYSIERKGVIYKSHSCTIKEVNYKSIREYRIEITKWSCRAFEGCEMVDGNIKRKRSVGCGVGNWQSISLCTDEIISLCSDEIINLCSDEVKLWGIVTLLLQNQPNCRPYKVNRPLKNNLNN